MAIATDPTTDFVAMMALEPHGPDVWVGTGPRYPWGGLYGGQIVAQALRAAAHTVEPQFHVHSLHAYFIRRGDHNEPVRYEVDRVRNGRSFVTRTVTARQAVGVILSVSISFQIDEDAPEVQSTELPPDVPSPSELEQSSWSSMFDRATVPADHLVGRSRGWMRIVGDLGDDPVLNACALAYMSDDYPTDAVMALHPERPTLDTLPEDHPFMAFSLDHAIWFHRRVQARDWHLTAMICHGILSSRGLAIGHVFTEGGVHVASVSQEVLLRRRRD